MHGTDAIELEEGFAQALFLPKGLGMRAGKLYFEFGKHNVYHTHQYHSSSARMRGRCCSEIMD